MSKYIIRKTSNGQYWWVLKAPNGETLLTSETYTTKGKWSTFLTVCKYSFFN